jgi:nitrogen fixation NifU-like protein
MTEDLDNFVKDLQDQINEETLAAYGPVAYARWRAPRFMGGMENPDGHGRVTGTCGDTMQVFLGFENERVKEASFLTDGCGSSAVCGSFAAELALDKTPDEITDVTGEYILEVLGGLPEEDRHCAFLAAEALQGALDDYMKRGTAKKR